MRLYKVTRHTLGTSDDRRAVAHLKSLGRGWWRGSPGARWWVENENAYLLATGAIVAGGGCIGSPRSSRSPVNSIHSGVGGGAVHPPTPHEGGVKNL